MADRAFSPITFVGGSLLAVLLFAAAVARCNSCVQENRADAEAARAEQAKREAAVDAERSRLQHLLCSPKGDELFGLIVQRIDGHRGFVERAAWDQLDLEAREAVAQWVALCKAGEDISLLIDGHTGETLATWGLHWGYDPE